MPSMEPRVVRRFENCSATDMIAGYLFSIRNSWQDSTRLAGTAYRRSLNG